MREDPLGEVGILLSWEEKKLIIYWNLAVAKKEIGNNKILSIINEKIYFADNFDSISEVWPRAEPGENV